MTQMTRNERIKASFDAAVAYDSAATVQRLAAGRLGVHISQSLGGQVPRTILEVGCGTGFLTEILRGLWPEAEIVATDYAPRMLERAQQRGLERVRFERMDLTQLDVDGPFDLVCGNLVLQWMDEPGQILKDLSALLAPGGLLAVSTLLEGTFAQWQAACRAEGGQAATPEYPSLASMQAIVPYPCAGAWQQESCVQPFVSGLEFVRHLKVTGAAVPRADVVALSPRQFRRAVRRLDAAGAAVTWELAYGCFRKLPRAGVFVTGTDTGVGKTLVSACLVRRWQAEYWKPLQSGLADEAGDTPTVQWLAGNPVCFPPALACQASLSPEAAARAEGVEVDPARLTLPGMGAQTPLVVEGAGGLMVPATSELMMIDLAIMWGLPVVLVARSGLGTLNHTLLSLEALRARGIAVAGVVLNGPENPENRRTIEEKGRVRVLAEIPHCADITTQTVDNLAKRLPTWADVIQPAR